MMDTTASTGKSHAVQIEANTKKAKKIMILAQADADLDVVCADGAKKAADLLATNSSTPERLCPVRAISACIFLL
jgi:hypothetical protein